MSSIGVSARWFSAEWRAALLGSLASVPITISLNIISQSNVTIAGGIVLFGAFMTGVLATRTSTRSELTGFRAGLLCALWILVVTSPPLVRFVGEIGVNWLGSPIATVLGSVFARTLLRTGLFTAILFCYF